MELTCCYHETCGLLCRHQMVVGSALPARWGFAQAMAETESLQVIPQAQLAMQYDYSMHSQPRVLVISQLLENWRERASKWRAKYGEQTQGLKQFPATAMKTVAMRLEMLLRSAAV